MTDLSFEELKIILQIIVNEANSVRNSKMITEKNKLRWLLILSNITEKIEGIIDEETKTVKSGNIKPAKAS